MSIGPHPEHNLHPTSPHNGVNFTLQREHDQVDVTITSANSSLLATLVKLERSLALDGATFLRIRLSECVQHHSHALSQLLFQPLGQHCFGKPLTYQQSVRFSVTEQCNYHCFFCHEEGLEMETRRHAASQEATFQLLAELKAQGINDFTFTGGEPLLKWNFIAACLDEMERIAYLPEITLVTNAERLKPVMLERLSRYPGKIRFNLSIHSLDPEHYLQIVHRMKGKNMGNPTLLDRIKQNIALIRATGLPFKLNIVLLHGINTHLDDLQQILDFGVSCGARAVKFLELLITEKLQQFYPYYYNLNNLVLTLKDRLQPLDADLRRRRFRYLTAEGQVTDLLVEMQYCTCSRGCQLCNLNRDANITAELNYFPCFLLPGQAMSTPEQGLSSCLQQGEIMVDAMAARYGQESPILIQNATISQEEQAYFYPLDETQWLALSRSLQLETQRIRKFTEVFYASNPSELHQFQFNKLSRNSYDEDALLVNQQIRVDSQGCHHTCFLGAGERVNDQLNYSQNRAKEGMYPLLTLNWEITYYRSSFGQLSLGHNKETGIHLLRSSTPLLWLTTTLQPLMRPVVHHVLAHLTNQPE